MRGPLAVLASLTIAATLAGCGLGDGNGRESARPSGQPAPTRGPVTTAEAIPTYPQPSVATSPLPALVGRTGTPAASLPAPGQVDGRDATAVARAVAQTMWTVDTTIDATRWDAAQRAAPFLTPRYAESLRLSPQVAAPGETWSTWAEHKSVTAVAAASADDLGKPEDTETSAFHAFTLTVTPTGRDGWRGPALTTTVFVSLERASAAQPWRVSSVRAAD
ncbi:hypothetical protein [Embleya scabrispora]|uniref:hypothetical protein n=1 Tax=Embleya scabrispora TaxID=159449 RepID=UPI000368C6E6|nr:hypothetical protein [Embleya scabrispora]MYS87378.1 hypothetical protein [Streptomyces sp. SID5474]